VDFPWQARVFDRANINKLPAGRPIDEPVARRYIMALNPHKLTDSSPALEVHLLGMLDFDQAEQFQQRLVYEAGGRADGQITVLVCEHKPIITVGRDGSYADVRLSTKELISRQLELRWVNRGGGCLIHGPGQLAVYPIVPLERRGWSVGEYLRRFQAGLMAMLDSLGISGETKEGRYGVWARTGLVAAMGVAVRDWTTYHGAFINICPTLELHRYVDTDPYGGRTMSSLVAARRRPIRMTAVRAALTAPLAEAFGCDRYHLHTSHPLLAQIESTRTSPAPAEIPARAY
jgi:lipoyl(octanoyl) transferase